MKKFFPVLLFIVLLVCVNPIFSYAAVGVYDTTTITSNKMADVIRGISEKFGVSVTNKQAQNVAGNIANMADNGDNSAKNFISGITDMVGTTTNGVTTYNPDPNSILGVVNYLYNFANSMSDAINGLVPSVKIDKSNKNSDGSYSMNDAFNSICGMYETDFFPKAPDDYITSRQFYSSLNSSNRLLSRDTKKDAPFSYYFKKPSTFTLQRDGSGHTFIPVDLYLNYTYPSGSPVYTDNSNRLNIYLPTSYDSIPLSNITLDSACGLAVYNFHPTSSDNVNLSPIDDTTKTNITNMYNNNTTFVYSTTIVVPSGSAYDSDSPWNSKDPGLTDAINGKSPPSTNDEPTDQPSGSSWWKWLFGGLIDGVKAIADFFKNIGQMLLGLIVPSSDFFTGFFDDLQTDFNNKIPMVTTMSDFFGQVKSVSTSGDAPTFKMTLPPEYGGGTFSIIDFSYFDQWRPWILNFIRFTLWFVFLKRLYNRIPKMIY
jgi:hypothetical protein